MKQCASVSTDDLIIRGLVNYRNNTINYKCRFVKFLKLTRKKKQKVNNLQLQFCRYIVFLLYTLIMIISTRRLLTSITREIGGFFVCIKFFQEILRKHPQKTLSHFKQMKGLIPNHEKVSPFTCINAFRLVCSKSKPNNHPLCGCE